MTIKIICAILFLTLLPITIVFFVVGLIYRNAALGFIKGSHFIEGILDGK